MTHPTTIQDNPKRKFYSGNYPGSLSGYDPNVPTGFNKWDAEDDGANYSDDEPEEVIPDEDWIVHDDEFDTDYK
jgi:hypothetical protein